MRRAAIGSRCGAIISQRPSQNRHGVAAVSSDARPHGNRDSESSPGIITGDRHGLVPQREQDNGACLRCRIRPRHAVMDRRGVGFPGPRWRPGHGQRLHPTGDGGSGLWLCRACDWRRVDRRRQAALARRRRPVQRARRPVQPRRPAQPRRQWQLMRGTITVPLGRNSCT